MKKPLIYSIIAILTLLISGGLTLVASTNATDTSDLPNLIASNANSDLTTTPLKQLTAKDESVYIITNNDGTPNKTFIGGNLYTENEPLPINLHITYYLDGSEISASDLVGKSGHIKITYEYTATVSYQGKLVPFLAGTGIQLDNTKFSNIKLNNGKIISEKNNYTIIGYGFAGLNENLNTDLLPDSFTIEADVTNFALGNSYTFATNELIAELDTTKLSSIDEIVRSINQLSNGFDQIITGSNQLDNGISSLVTGISQLQSGAESLNSGANQLATGAAALSTGAATINTSVNTVQSYLETITSNNTQIATGIEAALKPNDIITQINALIAPQSINLETYKEVLEPLIEFLPDTDPRKAILLQAINALDLYTGIISYINGVAAVTANLPTLSEGTASLASGASNLSDGTNQLLSGTIELKNGVDQLAAGSQQLSSGSKALVSGIQTFKTPGIDKLTNFANNNLASFTANLRASINAARNYHSYGNINSETVKFIFKTPSQW